MYVRLHVRARNCCKMLSWSVGQLCMLMTRFSVSVSYVHLDTFLSPQRSRERYAPSFCRRTTRHTSCSTSVALQVARWCLMDAEHSAVNSANRSSHWVCSISPLGTVSERNWFRGAANTLWLLR